MTSDRLQGPRRALALWALVLLIVPGSAGAQWVQNGAALCTAADDQFAPAIVPDGAGGAIVAWQDLRTGTADIYAQHVLSTGAPDPSWPANGRALCTASNSQSGPAIVSDGAGGAIVAWTDHRPATHFDVYVQHVLASGAVDPAWPADGRALCLAAGNQQNVAIVASGTGAAIVAWEDMRSGLSDVYAQRVLASGAVDPAWPADGRALCVATGAQIGVTLVTDGAQGAIAAWEDKRAGNWDVYAARVLVSGAVAPGWPVDGRALCAAADNQLNPAAVSDGAGGALVAWEDFRTAVDFDVYVQRVDAGGAVNPAWPVDGAALSTAAGNQQAPAVVADGAGGVLVTFEDYRSGTPDIYVHHALSNGIADPAWPADGRALCTASYDQVAPAVVSDGAGGVIAAWYDFRGHANYDVYAGRVKAGGTVDSNWPFNGRALCIANGDQYSPVLALDGAGGAIAAWYDYRGSTADIYAERVFAGGGAASVAPGPLAASFSLRAPWPNPARGGHASIAFDLPAAAALEVAIFDLAGHRVRTLAAADMGPGPQTLTWNGEDDRGRPVRDGVYLVSARGANLAATRKITWLH